jgi:hypothetical protein
MRTLTAGCLSFILAGTLTAAEIHGTISENGKALPSGVAVKLVCANASASAATDQFGGYSVKIDATGDCRLTVEYKGSSPSLTVSVYEKPSRYDLLVKSEGGKASLSRK